MRLQSSPRPEQRVIDPLAAVGGLLALIATTALITYAAFTLPGKWAAASGPPEHFREAATAQAQQSIAQTSTAIPAGNLVSLDESGGNTGDTSQPQPGVTSGPPPTVPGPTATTNPYGNWSVPGNVDADYWLSIPAIRVEAPIIAFSPWEREVDGATVLRLPVPNFYAVSWHAGSAEPGFGGNTVLTGHSNLYGGVFGDLDLLTFGQEVAIWSEFGVFSYHISQIEYIEENNQPLEVRLRNAQWLAQTGDSRVTLITCWPTSNSTHRLIIVATR